MTKRVEKSDVRIQCAPSQAGTDSSSPSIAQGTYDRTRRPNRGGSGLGVIEVTEGCAVHLTPWRSQRALAMIALVMCLVLILLPNYAGVATAQEQTAKESLIEGVVTNLNAYWEEQFQLLGGTYSPAELVFLYDHELVLGPCGLAFTGLGPGYCPYDGTLYYPIDWVDPATGMRLEEYGESAVEMVVAHEMAHHAQLQMQKFGIPGVESTPGTQMELEADCLAGAYANRAITQPAGIEAALAALGEAGGPGHGTSQQRIAAFELGYTTGDETQCLSLGNGGGATTQGGDSGVM
jgi:predicted metalloprotease